MDETKSIDEKQKELILSNCITNSNVIKYFVSVFFSAVLVFFCIFMISTSSAPSNETLWVSLLTTTLGVFIPQPQIKSS